MFAALKEYVRRARPTSGIYLIELIKHGSTLITKEACNGYFRRMIGFLARCIRNEEIFDG